MLPSFLKQTTFLAVTLATSPLFGETIWSNRPTGGTGKARNVGQSFTTQTLTGATLDHIIFDGSEKENTPPDHETFTAYLEIYKSSGNSADKWTPNAEGVIATSASGKFSAGSATQFDFKGENRIQLTSNSVYLVRIVRSDDKAQRIAFATDSASGDSISGTAFKDTSPTTGTAIAGSDFSMSVHTSSKKTMASTKEAKTTPTGSGTLIQLGGVALQLRNAGE